MRFKIIGSILLILGTAVGAGMLALPIVTAQESFFMTLVLLCSGWFLMTLGALCLLEVNLWFPAHTNFITMAEKTLGSVGKYIIWGLCLLLLYSLICAYLSSTSDVLQGLLSTIHISLPRAVTTLLSLSLFLLIVYQGIGFVDKVNRSLMSIKLIAYLILVILIVPHMQITPAFAGDYKWHASTFMVMITSFGYATIIPSIRSYLNDKQLVLRKVILIGSLLPLLIYAIWIFVVIAFLSRADLLFMSTADNSNTLLMQTLGTQSLSHSIAPLARLFISICSFTSFLCVSISLTDFLADGLAKKKEGKDALWVYGLSFLPPLLAVFISPGLFISALQYAGIICILLLVIAPLCMLYRGRYHLNLPANPQFPYSKALLLIFIVLASVLLILNSGLFH